jgi:hypothetical protein
MVDSGRIRMVRAVYGREMFTTIRWRERVTHNQPKRRGVMRSEEKRRYSSEN